MRKFLTLILIGALLIISVPKLYSMLRITPTVSFELASYGVDEFESQITLKVKLSFATGQDVTVSYSAADITATTGQDYRLTSGQLTFRPGEVEKYINVQIFDDASDEDNETFKVVLSSPTNAILGTPNEAIVTIFDNDPVYVYLDSVEYSSNEYDVSVKVKVKLSSKSGQQVTVDYSTQDITASAGQDYNIASGTLTFSQGEVEKEIQININDDFSDEENERFKLTLSNATNANLGTPSETIIRIIDDDPITISFEYANYSVNENVGQAKLKVKLSNKHNVSNSSISVDYSTQDITATANSDYSSASGTLTFNAGEIEKEINVTINDDTLNEDNETFKVKLSNATNAILGTPSEAIVTILDNDSLPLVYFNQQSINVNENAGSVSIVITLNPVSGQNVAVSYICEDISAEAGKDYTLVQGTLTIQAGTTSATISVPILNDTIKETTEKFRVILFNPTNANLGSPYVFEINITDNDDYASAYISLIQPVKDQQSNAYIIDYSQTTPTLTVQWDVSGYFVFYDPVNDKLIYDSDPEYGNYKMRVLFFDGELWHPIAKNLNIEDKTLTFNIKTQLKNIETNELITIKDPMRCRVRVGIYLPAEPGSWVGPWARWKMLNLQGQYYVESQHFWVTNLP